MMSVVDPALAADHQPVRHFTIAAGLILTASAAISLERLTGMGWFTDRLGRAVAWYWVVAMVVWAVDEGYLEHAF